MVTEVVHQSWGNRLMDSIKNVVFGVVLFLFSIGLLWWNEGNAVKNYQKINETRKAVVSIPSDTVSKAHEGKAVHLTGKAETQAVLKDPMFEVEANAIRLRRVVEMYQWQQNEQTTTKKNTGGSTDKTTTYSYNKVWSNRLISSDSFKESGHENPATMHPEGWKKEAQKVYVGSFALGGDAIRKINFYEKYVIQTAKLPENAILQDSVIFIGKSALTPEIGDIRIHFEVVPQETISIIAGQYGAELKSWPTSRGPYLDVDRGSFTAEEMLDQAKAEVNMMTWLIRVGGWFLMAFGMITVLSPFAVLGDVIPFIGSLLGGGIKIFSFISSAVISLTVIAIAWIASRPLVAIPLLLVAGLLIFLQWKKARSLQAKKKAAKQAQAKA
ncbi:TMEM43 family protein [Kiritimatiellota bacterium B12222]|nr:TMEM43 family protein [Kiritimatiellota bacterium B12222]